MLGVLPFFLGLMMTGHGQITLLGGYCDARFGSVRFARNDTTDSVGTLLLFLPFRLLLFRNLQHYSFRFDLRDRLGDGLDCRARIQYTVCVL